jgi:hypothetical protein
MTPGGASRFYRHHRPDDISPMSWFLARTLLRCAQLSANDKDWT